MDTYATATTTGGTAIEETDRLIASDKVEGTAVYNRQGERLGTVHNFMVDKSTGQVAYARDVFRRFPWHRRELPSAALKGTQLRYATGRVRHRSRPQPARESAELYGEQRAELV
jgi:hypothetical protein